MNKKTQSSYRPSDKEIDAIMSHKPMNSDHPRSFRFSDEEFELLTKLGNEYGSAKAAIIAGLRLLNEVPETDWPAELRRLAQKLEDEA